MSTSNKKLDTMTKQNKATVKEVVPYEQKKVKIKEKFGNHDFVAKLIVFAFSFITLLYISSKLFGDEM